MEYQSLRTYINKTTITKNEVTLIKDFCKENNIGITFFLNEEPKFSKYVITDFFVAAFNSLKDKEIVKELLDNQDKFENINFKKIIESYGKTLEYKDLLGFTKEDELKKLISEKKYTAIISLVKENDDLKNSNLMKNLIVDKYNFIEKFKKEKIPFHKDSYNEMDCEYSNTLNKKTKNTNMLQAEKFYKFINDNEKLINKESKERYLVSLLNHGLKTINDWYEESLWDLTLIPALHFEDFPVFKNPKYLMSNLSDYFSLLNVNNDELKEKNILKQHQEIKKIIDLPNKTKINLITNYIKNLEFVEYNYESFYALKNFHEYLSKEYINKALDEAIKKGNLFESSLIEDKNEKIKNRNLNIDTFSSEFKDFLEKNKELIGKKLLENEDLFKLRVFDYFININKKIVDQKDFILSLSGKQIDGLCNVLTKSNLDDESKIILNIRMEHSLPLKNDKSKQPKI